MSKTRTLNQESKRKKVTDFENLYSPGSNTQKYDDISNIVDLLERHEVPLDNFSEYTYTHLMNFIIHTAKRWDQQILEDLLHRDEQDGVD